MVDEGDTEDEYEDVDDEDDDGGGGEDDRHLVSKRSLSELSPFGEPGLSLFERLPLVSVDFNVSLLVDFFNISKSNNLIIVRYDL